MEGMRMASDREMQGLPKVWDLTALSLTDFIASEKWLETSKPQGQN